MSLTDADEETLAKKPTDDLRAYEFYMRRAYESGYRAVAHSATTDSAFDDVRGLPEFQRLVADLG